MLVATMSSSEVFDTLEKDLERVAAFTAHKEKALMKELRKSRLEMVSQSYDYHAPNADYIIIVRCNRKGYVSKLRFAFIKETLEYVGIVTQLGHRGIVSYSVHLLRRYAERVLHDTSLPMRKIFLKFTQNSVTACLYTDKDFFVTACDDGICLGKYVHTRVIIVHRTFVSVDMLKEKQLMAYEKIEGYVTLALAVRNKYGLYSEEFQKFQAEIPEKISLSADEAQRIYASYYGKDDDEGMI